MKDYYVYIMSNKPHGTLYVGITSDLKRRVWEHRNGVAEGFSKKHGLKSLVYYEVSNDAHEAIKREKRLKRWNRAWKITLIEEDNPNWTDLYLEL